MSLKNVSTYPECAKLDQYVRTFCETRALPGEDLKSKDEISGAKGRPKTRGSTPPPGSVSWSCNVYIFSDVRMARIEYKYLIYKQTSQYPGQGLGFTFAFSIKTKIFVVSTVLYYKIGCNSSHYWHKWK